MDLLQKIHDPEPDQRDVFLDHSVPYGVSSITVQTVLLHPLIEGAIYWVLNQQKNMNVNQRGMHTGPKPRGWGNPGGGVEIIDRIDEHGRPHLFEETIECCARRELVDETGFLNFAFKRNLISKLPFIRQDDPYGHSIIVLLARLHDEKSIPIKDTKEIIRGSWFDLSVSPVELFRDGIDLPYWSHVRRTITILEHVAEMTGNYRAVHHIHPLWHLAFRIFTQDSRFPQQGYLIPYTDWYHIMRVFIKRNIHHIDLDCIYEHLGPQIEKKRKQEHESGVFKKEDRSLLSNTYSSRIPTEQERMIAQYEEEYRRWAEHTLAN